MNRAIMEQTAKEYGTPAYVFDLDMLSKRLRMIKAVLGEDITLCYAMKANSFLVKPMEALVERFEVCSPGEFRICERNQIPMERIVLSGVYKEAPEVARVIDTYDGKGIYTVESLEHLRILHDCSTTRQQPLTVLLRLTSGNQFGMDEETICNIIAQRQQYPFLNILGLQYYSGTQKKKMSRIAAELEMLDALCGRLAQDYGFTVPELEYGPGFYVPYFQNEEDVDDQAMLREFKELLDKLTFSGHISLEMGRYMAAYCGYFLTSVVDLKTNNEQNYCIIDGGIHHMNYYGQTMAMKFPHYVKIPEAAKQPAQNWNICGSLCTVSDVLIKQLPLHDLQIHDILVFERLGAYSVTEGIYLFLSRDLPKILFYSEADGITVIRDTMPTDTINSAQ